MTDITPVFHLPKWPALIVEGELVSSEQAAEIIIRTGQWPVMTNDRKWEDIIAQHSGCIPSYRNMDYSLPYEQRVAKYETWEKAHEAFKHKYGIIDLQYMNNSRIASSWVGGAHGWMDWDGSVRCGDYNVGKWPTSEAVLADWKAIAEAFPYLDLTAQLLNMEAGEAAGEYGGEIPVQALVEYRVKDGKVTVHVPDRPLTIPHSDMVTSAWNRDERGCSEETLKWALEVTAKAVANKP